MAKETKDSGKFFRYVGEFLIFLLNKGTIFRYSCVTTKILGSKYVLTEENSAISSNSFGFLRLAENFSVIYYDFTKHLRI